MVHGIRCLHIWWPGVWRSSGKRPRDTEQDRAPSLLGQHRVSHHDQQSTRICGTGIYWEFARVNSRNAKFLRQSVVSATHRLTDYWWILPAFMLCSREWPVHSSRTRQECLISRTLLLSIPLTATSIPRLGETKKSNAQLRPTSIQRDSSRKLPAIYSCTQKKTKYITTKNSKAVLEKSGKQNLTIAFAANELNILCFSFKEAGPQIFQEGDIVELQVSFIVVPIRDQKCRMSIILRGVSLLEGIFTQVSAILKNYAVDANIKQFVKATFRSQRYLT